MSTVKATNISHTSASVNNITLGSDGLTTFNGPVVGSGLDHIVTESFSAVSSVSVNECFSATYTNYLILPDITTVSGTNVNILFYMRASGTDTTTNYLTRGYEAVSPNINYKTNSTAVIGQIDSGEEYWNFTSLQLRDPFATQVTSGFCLRQFRTDAGNYQTGNYGYAQTTATSYDGCTLTLSGGTMSGTIRIYGYKD